MKLLTKLGIVACLSGAVAWRCEGQTNNTSACSATLPRITTSALDIFNDKQEQDLGDALAEYYEPTLHLAAPAADDQLTRIGQRLLATLPPTGIRYTFRIYDSADINAFSLAGGRVYVSRKLIASVKSEDELAGVVAHEIGHLATHQVAISVSRALHFRLGITAVGDRADIFAKVHQLFSTPSKLYEKDSTEEDREVLADRLALYELVDSGYSPESFAAFMDESMVNKGNKGGLFSDIFGLTRESAKRYRAAMNLIDELPDGCKSRQPQSNEAFNLWLRTTKDQRIQVAAEEIEGDRPLVLDPPLRPNLSRIRFSPDGRLVLAQDESGISVEEIAAGKTLFRIDAPDVEPAQFTPDSKNVIFSDRKLRVEQWNVADGKQVSVKELVVFDGCNQTLLMPDAKTFACAFANVHGDYLRIGVRLIDVESGKPFFEKEGFFEPGVYTPYAARLLGALRTRSEYPLMNILATPDSKYLLLVAGDRVSAWDLTARQPIALAGKLQKLSQARMSFMGSNQLYAVFQAKGPGMYVADVMTFPQGQVVKETELADQQVDPVTKGNALIVSPLKDYAVGILDPIQEKVLTAARLPAIDAWDTTVALEDAIGGVAVAQMGTPGSKHIPLTQGPLPIPTAAVFSPDGKYLAVSMKNRAMIWNLETGKQLKMVRPFRSAWIDSNDQLLGLFPQFMKLDPVEIQLTLEPFASSSLAKLEETDRQYRDLQYTFQPMDKKETSEHPGLLIDRGVLGQLILRTGKDIPPDRHVTLEVKNLKTQALLWSREYPNEAPVCWPSDDNRLVLAWDLGTTTAKLELTRFPALQKQAEAINSKKKGLLVETVNADSGDALEQVVVPEVDLSRGWHDPRVGMVSGKFVLVRGEDRVTGIYRLEDGSKVGEFIGSAVATNASLGLIAAVNRENEILLVEESKGNELTRFSFATPVRLAEFVSGKENLLLVLTADQVVHRIPMTSSLSRSASIAP
jgi:WD40 repeat protein